MTKKKVTKKKAAAKDIKAQIKEMENQKRLENAAPSKEKKVSFDSWHHQRNHLIPKQHKKEIIKADFKSRGLGDMATIEEFDKALKLYGVTL